MNDPAATVETVEISIQKLVKSLNTRQKWQQVFKPRDKELSDHKSPWRTKLLGFLESTPVHAIAILLLLADLALTTLELSSSVLSCTHPRKNHDHHSPWYHWVGVSILAVLAVRMAATVVGMGGRAFCRRPGYVVDAAAVVGALVLEAGVEVKGGGLLVVASLWRVVRVVESAFEVSDEAIEAQIAAVVIQFELLREENARLLAAIAEKDELIADLQQQTGQCAVTFEEFELEGPRIT